MAAPTTISPSGGGKTANAAASPKNTSANPRISPALSKALAPLRNTPWSWIGGCHRLCGTRPSEPRWSSTSTNYALTRILHKPVEQMGGRGVRKLENSELYDNQLRRPEPNRL